MDAAGMALVKVGGLACLHLLRFQLSGSIAMIFHILVTSLREKSGSMELTWCEHSDCICGSGLICEVLIVWFTTLMCVSEPIPNRHVQNSDLGKESWTLLWLAIRFCTVFNPPQKLTLKVTAQPSMALQKSSRWLSSECSNFAQLLHNWSPLLPMVNIRKMEISAQKRLMFSLCVT